MSIQGSSSWKCGSARAPDPQASAPGPAPAPSESGGPAGSPLSAAAAAAVCSGGPNLAAPGPEVPPHEAFLGSLHRQAGRSRSHQPASGPERGALQLWATRPAGLTPGPGLRQGPGWKGAELAQRASTPGRLRPGKALLGPLLPSCAGGGAARALALLSWRKRAGPPAERPGAARPAGEGEGVPAAAAHARPARLSHPPQAPPGVPRSLAAAPGFARRLSGLHEARGRACQAEKAVGAQRHLTARPRGVRRRSRSAAWPGHGASPGSTSRPRRGPKPRWERVAVAGLPGRRPPAACPLGPGRAARPSWGRSPRLPLLPSPVAGLPSRRTRSRSGGGCAAKRRTSAEICTPPCKVGKGGGARAPRWQQTRREEEAQPPRPPHWRASAREPCRAANGGGARPCTGPVCAPQRRASRVAPFRPGSPGRSARVGSERHPPRPASPARPPARSPFVSGAGAEKFWWGAFSLISHSELM